MMEQECGQHGKHGASYGALPCLLGRYPFKQFMLSYSTACTVCAYIVAPQEYKQGECYDRAVTAVGTLDVEGEH